VFKIDHLKQQYLLIIIYKQILAKLVELEHKNMEMEEQAGFRAGR
jgi:hypothetical protein